jgi:hypothetical protein
MGKPMMSNKLSDNIEEWDPDHVKIFLEKRINDFYFEQSDIDKLCEQKINGKAFLRLTEEKLIRINGSYKLKGGPAEAIMELVEELNGNHGKIKYSNI